jgi:hypothetical protein
MADRRDDDDDDERRSETPMIPESQMPEEAIVVPVRWRRRLASVQAAAVAGIVSAVCWSIGLRGLLATPALDATDSEIIDFYRDPETAVSASVLLQVVVVGTIAFLWFVGVIRSRLGDVEPRLFGTVFLGGAILLAMLIFVGTAALAAPTVLVDVGQQTPEPGSAAMTRSVAAIVLSVFAPRVAALFMFSTATLGRATGALPTWLVVITYLIGVGQLINVTISQPSIYVVPAWTALVSVVLLVRPPAHGFGLEAPTTGTR